MAEISARRGRITNETRVVKRLVVRDQDHRCRFFLINDKYITFFLPSQSRFPLLDIVSSLVVSSSEDVRFENVTGVRSIALPQIEIQILEYEQTHT